MSANLRANIARFYHDIAYLGNSANAVIPTIANHVSDNRDVALVKECLFGTARLHETLQWQLSQLLQKPIKKKESVIEALLLTALYQLWHLDIPDHAVISESVNATRKLKKDWASRMVNGVLRNAVRRQQELVDPSSWPEPAIYQLPEWLLKRLKNDWPDHWQAIAKQTAAKPPMILRWNEHQLTAQSASKLLQEKAIGHAFHHCVPSAIKLDKALSVTDIPDFEHGAFSVQDTAAQLAAHLLPVTESDATVLDACAAPGGKTAHLLERFPHSNLTALDNDAKRAERITQNLKRIGLTAKVEVADASHWQTKQSFDAILLDAPCSATGVIRRQPDIKRHRTDADIDQVTQLQAKLLQHLWSLVRKGGHLLYATCSILKAENSEQIERFLANHSDANVVEFPSELQALSQSSTTGLQLFPSEWHDGFYYCLLKKGN